MENQGSTKAVQAQVLDRLLAQLSEHFEHFALVVVPGGGGEVLGSPRWGWSGNRVVLSGSLEMAKLDIATAASSAGRTQRGGRV